MVTLTAGNIRGCVNGGSHMYGSDGANDNTQDYVLATRSQKKKDTSDFLFDQTGL